MRRFQLAGAFLVTVVLSACGGGGGGGTCDASSQSVKSGFAGDQNWEGPAGGGGGGGAGGDGGGVGVGVGEGKVFGATITVWDQDRRLIGKATTDPVNGMVTVKLCNSAAYDKPLEVEVQGNDTATYYDEAKNETVRFGADKILRARVPLVTTNIGITAFTDGAVRLMDGAGNAIGTRLDPVVIKQANDQVGKVLTDQVPGIYRPGQGTAGAISITRWPVVLDKQSASTPGTIDPEAAATRGLRAQYGAVNAGFGRASGTFLPGDPSPAFTASSQFARDLSDGVLDMQAIDGPVVGSSGALAYTYETLWRAKTIGAGLTTAAAGTDGARQKSSNVVISEYLSSAFEVYKTDLCRENGVSCDFATRTSTSQIVKLFGDGRLEVRREMAAGFDKNKLWVEATPLSRRVGFAGAPQAAFVEVKVGTQGEIVALDQARNRFVYIPPTSLYRVRGNEGSDANAISSRLTAQLAQFGGIEIPAAPAGTSATVVSFTPSPPDRSFVSGPKPDFIYVMSDGKLYGGRQATPGQPIALPVPEPLQSVVYDKFVPPAFPAQYGPRPGGTILLPWTGPRRLFGLTRGGTVKTWIEGNTAVGVTLPIPGKVRLLAGEALTGVYALNNAGNVYWINADQALAVGGSPEDAFVDGRLPDPPRRFGPHTVVPVDLGGKPICWITRTEAVVCDSGEVIQWTEARANLISASEDRVFVPVDLGAGKVIPGLSSVWRMSGVEEFSRRSLSATGTSRFNEGIRYVKVDGATTDPEAALGHRNLALTRAVTINPDSRGPRPYVTGRQFRRAIESVIGPASPLSTGLARQSTSAGITGHIGSVRLSGAPGGFDLTMAVTDAAGAPDAFVRPAAIRIALDSGDASASTSFTMLDVIGDDPERRNLTGNPPPRAFGQAATFKDDDLIALDFAPFGWFGEHVQPVFATGDFFEKTLIGRLIPSAVPGNPYQFRICYNASAAQVRGVNTFGYHLCTQHDNVGNYLGRFTMSAGSRVPGQAPRQFDFGQLLDDGASPFANTGDGQGGTAN